MERRITVLVAVAVAVTITPACGGDGDGNTVSRSEYQEKLTAVGEELRGAEEALAKAGTGGGSVSAQVAYLRTGLRAAAEELAQITPPSDVQVAHDRLVAGLRALDEDLAPAEEASGGDGQEAVQAAFETLRSSDGVAQIRAALEDLKAAGYTGIGPGT